MNSFGQELYVLNKDNFECMFKQTYMLKLRKKLYLFMISNRNENDFFDIEKFNRKYIRDMNKTKTLLSLNNIANVLDNSGLYKEANTITNVMKRLAKEKFEFFMIQKIQLKKNWLSLLNN